MKEYDIFLKTLKNLETIRRPMQPLDDVILRAGIIGLFVLCYDQSLRAMKEYLEAEGLGEMETTHQIVKAALEIGLITDEGVWLTAEADRDLELYTFDEEIAIPIAARAKEIYLPLFEYLAARLGE